MTQIPRTTVDINLLLAVESRMDGQLLTSALEHPRHHLMVRCCGISKAEIAASADTHCLNIALVSENLQDGPLTGFHMLSELRNLCPGVRSIILLKTDDYDFVVDAFRAGAKGVFCRTECLTLLPRCIRAVHGGHIWANSKQLDRVLAAFASASPLKLTSATGRRLLTKREEDVVRLVIEGLSNREAAHKLGLTEHTVSNYLFRVYEKLGISSRVELVLYSVKDRRP
jgi:DNA-binding NarL/FixJ family response regulator